MASVTVGLVGLGKMGLAIAYRLAKVGHAVVGFDPNHQAQQEAISCGVICVGTLQELFCKSQVIWIMVPAGKTVDDVIQLSKEVLRSDHIIIDGGNSFFKDSIRRAQELNNQKVPFLDCGTSGGLHGKELGFSLMIGGSEIAFKKIEPVFQAIAAPSGYAYVGPAGAGHFVKMVHNGIEYAALQAYAEGFHVLKQGPYKLDLEQISSVWNHGSIIRSWILELAHRVFKQDQSFVDISGDIGENLTGQWTVDVAHEHNVPVRTIEDALNIRAWSRQTGGNYATKLVALLRHEFGGHPIKKIKHD